jgi:hypothetical protein
LFNSRSTRKKSLWQKTTTTTTITTTTTSSRHALKILAIARVALQTHVTKITTYWQHKIRKTGILCNGKAGCLTSFRKPTWLYFTSQQNRPKHSKADQR